MIWLLGREGKGKAVEPSRDQLDFAFCSRYERFDGYLPPEWFGDFRDGCGGGTSPGHKVITFLNEKIDARGVDIRAERKEDLLIIGGRVNRDEV